MSNIALTHDGSIARYPDISDFLIIFDMSTRLTMPILLGS